MGGISRGGEEEERMCVRLNELQYLASCHCTHTAFPQ